MSKSAEELLTRSAGKGRDRSELLAGMERAQFEAQSFADLHQSVRRVNALVEMLFQITRSGNVGDADVNWHAVNGAIEDARELLGPVYSATSALREGERRQEARDVAEGASARRVS